MDVLALRRRLPMERLAGPAAVAALAAGALYCQAHGLVSGVRGTLGLSLWWSASGILPILAVCAAAARAGGVIRRRPLAALGVLTAAFAIALALGEALYAERLLAAASWTSGPYRALPAAAGLALLALGGVRFLREPEPLPAPDPLRGCDVALIRSAGNYLSLEAGGREVLVRLTLREAARRLAPRGFVQAHRTALVNLARVAEARREGRRLILRLDDGRTVAVGRAYAARVRSSLNQRRSSQDG